MGLIADARAATVDTLYSYQIEQVATAINMRDGEKVDKEIIDVVTELENKITAVEVQAQKRYLENINLRISFLEKQKYITDNEIALYKVLKQQASDLDFFK